MKNFDNYLKTTDKKQKIMIILSFIICVGFLLNQFIPPLIERQKELIQSVDSLETRLSKNNTSRLKGMLALRKKALLSANEELDSKKDEINYIMSNIYKIKYSFFNDTQWANTLDDMLRYSIRKNLKVISLKNSDATESSSSIIKHKKNIKINGTGSYKDILSFLQYIENFDSLLVFKNIDLALEKDEVAFDFEINAYGAGL